MQYVLEYPKEPNLATKNQYISNEYNGFARDTQARLDKNKFSKGDYARAGISFTPTDWRKLIRAKSEFNTKAILTVKNCQLVFTGERMSFNINIEALGIKQKLVEGSQVFCASLLDKIGILPSIKEK